MGVVLVTKQIMSICQGFKEDKGNAGVKIMVKDISTHIIVTLGPYLCDITVYSL